MKRKWLGLCIYSILHFIVDFLCGYQIISVDSKLEINRYALFLLYNGIAFLGQIPFGLLLDKKKGTNYYLVISTICLCFGFIFSNWVIRVIFLGIANAMFHVVGGKNVAVDFSRSFPLGFFVSFGALGLYFGSITTKVIFVYLCLIGYIIGASILLFLSLHKEDSYEKTIPIQPIKKNILYFLCVALIMIAVFIRSFLGNVIHKDFTLASSLLFLLPFSAFLGKMCGGLFNHKFGPLKTICFFMVLSFLLFWLGAKSPICIILGIFSINISMPITLYELNQKNKGQEGFNFGLLAGLLFLGVWISNEYIYQPNSYFIILLLSTLLTIISFVGLNRYDHLKN